MSNPLPPAHDRATSQPGWRLVLLFCLVLSCLSGEARVDPSSTTSTGGQEAARVKRLYLEGQAALLQGDLDTAESRFRKVLALDPSSAGAYSNLGTIAMKRGQWQNALSLLRNAQRLAPGVAGIRLNIGLAYYRQNDFNAAIPEFASVVHDQPDAEQARYLLGLCQFFSKRYAEAARNLEILWPKESGNLSYLYVLGVAAQYAGQKELEEKALGQLVNLGENTPLFHLLMGKAYFNQQDDQKARAEFDLAAHADPKFPFVHFDLGRTYLKQQDFERAKEEFLKDVELEPDVPFNYDQLGVISFELQQNQDAVNYFHEALERDPRLTSSYFGLARVYTRQGDYKDALEALNAAVKLAPGNASVRYLRGQTLQHLGRQPEAQKELKAAAGLMAAKRDEQRKTLEDEAVSDPELLSTPQ